MLTSKEINLWNETPSTLCENNFLPEEMLELNNVYDQRFKTVKSSINF